MLPPLEELDAVTVTGGLFDDLRPATRAALTATKRPALFSAGDDLYSMGAEAAFLCCLQSGRVKVWRPARDGGAMTLYYLGPGATPGLVAIARRAPWTATLTAVTPVATFAWPAALVRRLLHDDPHFAANALRIVSNTVEIIVNRLEDVTGASAEQQIGRALLRLAGEHAHWADDGAAAIDISRQELADLTGSTLYTASRTLSDWARQGVVESRRGRVVIRDLRALARIAGVEE